MKKQYGRLGGRKRNYSEARPQTRRAHRNFAPKERLSGRLTEISVEGFKSLKNVNLPLKSVNILIGANGVGKSNTLGFFEMISYMMSGDLQEYVRRKGGGDALLFNGAKQTRSMRASLAFASNTGKNEYEFRLSHTEDNALAFSEEQYRFTPKGEQKSTWNNMGIGHVEAKIIDPALHKSAHITKRMMQNCDVYQFHDTSPTSPIKVGWDVGDVRYVKGHGGNLASVLLDMRENWGAHYNELVRIIRQAVPIFKDFDLHTLYGKVALRWTPQNDSDKSFGAHLTSDGTLRLMALVTLLCMPDERMSDVILLDEPELGLHPEAIALVAALIKRVSRKKQVIVATQSPLLLNEFSVDDIAVAEMNEKGETEFRRLMSKDFLQWLDEFKAGDLWQKNLLGGNP